MNLLRLLVTAGLALVSVRAADQPQWGQAWSRNMVSGERGLPVDFDPKTGKHVKWVAKLGNETHSTPVVANGRVYIGTNNHDPRDPKHVGDRGVMMCFDEKTGKLLWQFVVPKREEDKYHDWPNTGMSSPVTVEDDRVYLVDSRGSLVCLDAKGMADGNDGPFKEEGLYMVQKPMAGETNPQSAIRNPQSAIPTPGPFDADILWKFDLTAGAGIWSHDGAHSSVLIHGDHLYLNSGTGVDNTHKKIRTPDAPSLVVLDKRTGRLVARDDEHIAPNIFHATWSSPSLGKVSGRDVIFFCGGDGIVRAFEPLAKSPPAGEVSKLKSVWHFDPDPGSPKDDPHRFLNNRQQGPSNIYGMPVVMGDRLFVSGGGDVFWVGI